MEQGPFSTVGSFSTLHRPPTSRAKNKKNTSLCKNLFNVYRTIFQYGLPIPTVVISTVNLPVVNVEPSITAVTYVVSGGKYGEQCLFRNQIHFEYKIKIYSSFINLDQGKDIVFFL